MLIIFIYSLSSLQRTTRRPSASHSRSHHNISARKTTKWYCPPTGTAAECKGKAHPTGVNWRAWGTLPWEKDIKKSRGPGKNSRLSSIRRGSQLIGIDQLTSNLMQCSEKKWYKLHARQCEFTPKSKWWLDRCHAFRQLLRIQTGKKVRNHDQYQKIFPTVWNRQPNAAFRKRSSQIVQTIQSDHKKSYGRIPMDAKIIPPVPTPRSSGRWKSGWGNKTQGYSKKWGTE